MDKPYEHKIPLVSIGMPVYNGEPFIRQALDSLIRQTFGDFELIISDNASNDGTQRICEEYATKDQRIRYIRQSENRGPVFNFNFVLEQANGEYFMWAAADDTWDKSFIEIIVSRFDMFGNGTVAIGSEAQYTIEGVRQPFFPEGKRFYNSNMSSSYERVKHMLRHNYGNLYYSIYRREVLIVNGKGILSALSPKSLNEIPLLITVAEQGNWLILNDILFFKETNRTTFEHAKWEMEGGELPATDLLSYIREIGYDFIYHAKTAYDVNRSISFLNFSRFQKLLLKILSVQLLFCHVVKLIVRKQREGRN